MADYPDWTRLFHLVGTEITIPINIEASDVTLPVSIAASEVTLSISLDASTIMLNVNIASQGPNLAIYLAASAITLDISFHDQSVAVFDAAKWFAHEAQQVFIDGTVSVASGSAGLCCSRTVPADKTYFITFISWASEGTGSFHAMARLSVISPYVISGGGGVGVAIAFDTPIRVEHNQALAAYVTQWSGAEQVVRASIGGYDEDYEA